MRNVILILAFLCISFGASSQTSVGYFFDGDSVFRKIIHNENGVAVGYLYSSGEDTCRQYVKNGAAYWDCDENITDFYVNGVDITTLGGGDSKDSSWVEAKVFDKFIVGADTTFNVGDSITYHNGLISKRLVISDAPTSLTPSIFPPNAKFFSTNGSQYLSTRDPLSGTAGMTTFMFNEDFNPLAAPNTSTLIQGWLDFSGFNIVGLLIDKNMSENDTTINVRLAHLNNGNVYTAFEVGHKRMNLSFPSWSPLHISQYDSTFNWSNSQWVFDSNFGTVGQVPTVGADGFIEWGTVSGVGDGVSLMDQRSLNFISGGGVYEISSDTTANSWSSLGNDTVRLESASTNVGSTILIRNESDFDTLYILTQIDDRFEWSNFDTRLVLGDTLLKLCPRKTVWFYNDPVDNTNWSILNTTNFETEHFATSLQNGGQIFGQDLRTEIAQTAGNTLEFNRVGEGLRLKSSFDMSNGSLFRMENLFAESGDTMFLTTYGAKAEVNTFSFNLMNLGSYDSIYLVASSYFTLERDYQKAWVKIYDPVNTAFVKDSIKIIPIGCKINGENHYWLTRDGEYAYVDLRSNPNNSDWIVVNEGVSSGSDSGTTDSLYSEQSETWLLNGDTIQKFPYYKDTGSSLAILKTNEVDTAIDIGSVATKYSNSQHDFYGKTNFYGSTNTFLGNLATVEKLLVEERISYRETDVSSQDTLSGGSMFTDKGTLARVDSVYLPSVTGNSGTVITFLDSDNDVGGIDSIKIKPLGVNTIFGYPNGYWCANSNEYGYVSFKSNGTNNWYVINEDVDEKISAYYSTNASNFTDTIETSMTTVELITNQTGGSTRGNITTLGDTVYVGNTVSDIKITVSGEVIFDTALGSIAIELYCNGTGYSTVYPINHTEGAFSVGTFNRTFVYTGAGDYNVFIQANLSTRGAVTFKNTSFMIEEL